MPDFAAVFMSRLHSNRPAAEVNPKNLELTMRDPPCKLQLQIEEENMPHSITFPQHSCISTGTLAQSVAMATTWANMQEQTSHQGSLCQLSWLPTPQDLTRLMELPATFWRLLGMFQSPATTLNFTMTALTRSSLLATK